MEPFTRPNSLQVEVSLQFGSEPESEASPPRDAATVASGSTPTLGSVTKKRALSTTSTSSSSSPPNSIVTMALSIPDKHDNNSSNSNSDAVSQPDKSTLDVEPCNKAAADADSNAHVDVDASSSSSSSSKNVDQGIDPHDLMLLKVIGRGTFAQQVALAKHTPTQSMYVVKTLDKRHLVQRKQVAHTLAEKHVLETLGDGDHPFIVKLYAAFQTERALNFVLEYCQGGELFYHLQQQQQQKFDERATRFYAAEVLAALDALHAQGIVYRDLKPENVLLDATGHVKLADFGFAKQDMAPNARTYSFCGSPEYLSPEMVAKNGHGVATDMWSFGCFCFELLTGAPPFALGNSLAKLFERIRQGRVWYPPYLSGPAVALLEGLLCVNPSARLTASQAMDHAFFKTLNWSDVRQRHVAPPIVPVCSGVDCTQNFDDGFTREPVQSLQLDKASEKSSSSSKSSTSSGQQPKRIRPDANACGFYATDPLAEFQDF